MSDSPILPTGTNPPIVNNVAEHGVYLYVIILALAAATCFGIVAFLGEAIGYYPSGALKAFGGVLFLCAIVGCPRNSKRNRRQSDPEDIEDTHIG